MSLHTVFSYLRDSWRRVETVREVRVLDEGAMIVNQSPFGFDEDIAVYLLAGELSLEFIKQSVNGNSRSDIHTLFILSRDLLPDDGSNATPNESLRLLLELYGGKVFAYGDEGRTVTIFPVYIDGKVTYGQPVDIANLSADYVEVRASKVLRGVRKIADFKQQNFSHNRSQSTERRVYDPLKPFYDLLEIPLTASEDEVKKAYRLKARQHHPDADPSPDATIKMQAINEAYDKISKRFNLVT
jgi:hypothetical protein